MRGAVRGISIFESTKVADWDAAEAVRIFREKELFEESLFGRKVNVTFDEAAQSYLRAGGSKRFLERIRQSAGSKLLRKLRQNDLDGLAQTLFPAASPETRNRQCYTPFIAVWNHAVRNDWAELRLWQRPKRAKGTAVRRTAVRSGSRPVDYERAALFVSAMSPAPAMVMTALFYTGMRPIELFALEATDVLLPQRWIVLASSKTGEPRGIPIHEFLVPLFQSLLGRRDRLPQLFRSYRGSPYQIASAYGGQLSNSIVATRRRLAAKGKMISDVSPYTARHSVSTQLVVNGVHPHIKDQILGHAADSMSRRYTAVPQAPLIDAINTLPVPELWRALHWWKAPLAYSRHHVKWGKVSD